MKSEELLDIVLKAISERHGEDTEAYDMRGISILSDFFVATSASSSRQLHATSMTTTTTTLKGTTTQNGSWSTWAT